MPDLEKYPWTSPEELKMMDDHANNARAEDPLPLVAPDLINHPPHYTSSPAACSDCGYSIECIDITEHQNFNIGNAIKYLWRVDGKGSWEKDLEKAIWYIQREISRRQKLEKNQDDDGV